MVTRASTGKLTVPVVATGMVIAVPGLLGYDITIPIRTVSEANQREHWAKKAKRAKKHRVAAALAARAYIGSRALALPLTVKLIRVAPRKLDDDNLRGALKATRDGIADWLGVNDADERVRWDYGQERGTPKYYGVRAEIRKAQL